MAGRPAPALLLLFALLGFCAGLPLYLFSTILSLRLARGGVDLTTIGFFAWVTLLPTFKFLWAPLLDRYAVPGFARFWGKRRGWIMLSQLGIVASMVGLGLAWPDRDLTVTAFWALLLAFWTSTLEIAADAWRIELAPTRGEQGPIVAANIWGYRAAMIAAGSGALIVADGWGWIAAYLVIAVAGFLPFPLLMMTRAEAGGGGRSVALLTGMLVAVPAFLAVALAVAGIGWAALTAFAAAGISPRSNVTPWVLGIAMAPFVAMALAIPAIRRMGPSAPARRSAAIGPYVDIFWRFGFAMIAIMMLVSLYRMGDVLAMTLSKPFVNALGYSLTQIGVADGGVALAASMAGVGLGGWVAAKWTMGRAMALGALLAAVGNFAFVWLDEQSGRVMALYIATAADHFGNGFAGAVFVVFLSLLVNPLHAGAQYAFLSGFAFLLPRLIAGGSGAMQGAIGYSGFFMLSGVLSLTAIPLLPFVLKARPRPEDG